jgi:hypothetical protein
MSIRIQTPSKADCPDLNQGDLITHLIPERLKVHERELFQTKWWDYRFMTPFEATCAYIDAFGQQARKVYSRDIDSERAAHIKVVTSAKVVDAFLQNDAKAKRAMSGFWRGRQVADAIGMPYPAYVFEAISQRMRRWQRAYLPSENQIYQEGDVERVSSRWSEVAASRIHYSDHHAYLSQNYEGAPAQKGYYDYLVQRSAQTGDKIMTLVDMVEADRISLEYLQTDHAGIYDQVRASLP